MVTLKSAAAKRKVGLRDAGVLLSEKYAEARGRATTGFDVLCATLQPSSSVGAAFPLNDICYPINATSVLGAAAVFSYPYMRNSAWVY